MTLTSSTSRRALFKSIAQGSAKPLPVARLRPPGALIEASFLDVCERCDDCISACPEHVIKRGDGGFPELDFKTGGCTRCTKCIAACESGALAGEDSVVLGQWTVNARCLPTNNVTCQSCKDACDAQAISFPYTSSNPTPLIDLNSCTGCGECVSVCPVDAIAIKPLATAERVNQP